MSSKSNAEALLRTALDNPSATFRDGQWEAIDALVNRQERLLVVQRTGWGKSSVYFIATRILRDRAKGPTLIVSPLLALMRNQIEAGRKLGISVVTMNSTNKEDWEPIKSEILRDNIDALLISPERLANEEFVREVLEPISGRLGMLVVDEAHCISDWGHDFRPDYRRLLNILQRMPDNMPILGTTATANDRVIDDIQCQLGDVTIQRGSLMRESLSLQVLELPTQTERLAWLADHVPEMHGTGIIYTLTKRDAKQVTDWLNQNGIDAHAYFSGVEHPDFESSDSYRQHLEDQLLNSNIKTLVATTALGMGYDKPDLGFVIHYQAPGSIVAYYQQVGRAGRAIPNATGIMMAGDEDATIHEYFRKTAFPKEEWVSRLLLTLEASDGMSVRELEQTLNLRHGQINQVLKYLDAENPSPLLKDGPKWRRTAVRYQMDHAKISRLTQQREVEWAEVSEYVQSKTCRMLFLANVLNDPNPKACGKCDICTGHPVVDTVLNHQSALAAGRFLKHSEFELNCNKQAPSGAFAHYDFPFRLPAELRAETGRVLSRWADAGWGSVVATDKAQGHFSDQLVDAIVAMVKRRWQPSPEPVWVTCIPSLNNPTLVPDFAGRVAGKLELPFIPVIDKVRQNDPQKLQQNSFHQCQNLDGVFEIAEGGLQGPVLLLDDVVDSAWTLTVAAALLLKSGCGPVYPCALTTSSIGA